MNQVPGVEGGRRGGEGELSHTHTHTHVHTRAHTHTCTHSFVRYKNYIVQISYERGRGGERKEGQSEGSVVGAHTYSEWRDGRGVGRGRGGKEWEEGTGRDSKQN